MNDKHYLVAFSISRRLFLGSSCFEFVGVSSKEIVATSQGAAIDEFLARTEDANLKYELLSITHLEEETING